MNIYQIYIFDMTTKTKSHSGIEVEAEDEIAAEIFAVEHLGLDSTLYVDAVLGTWDEIVNQKSVKHAPEVN